MYVCKCDISKKCKEKKKHFRIYKFSKLSKILFLLCHYDVPNVMRKEYITKLNKRGSEYFLKPLYINGYNGISTKEQMINFQDKKCHTERSAPWRKWNTNAAGTNCVLLKEHVSPTPFNK